MTELNLKHLPGEDNITRTVLPNGMIVLCSENFSSPSVVVSGYLQTGSIYDPVEKLGLALFTSYALMNGTVNKRFQRIYNDLESVGASFGFGASVQTTGFGGRALTEDLPLLLNTLSDCIQWPIFPPRQFRRLKAQFLTGLQLRQQDTADMSSLKFDEILFKNHPYGVPEDGYFETVMNITRNDLVKFHQKTYQPKNMVICIVGAISAQNAVDMVYKTLGGWKGNPSFSEIEIPEIPPTHEIVQHHIQIPGKVQADLIMGGYGPKRISEDFLPASIGNNILGQFGMMGRIGSAVREKSGLAYHASTSLNAWTKGGSWEISAGLHPDNVHKAIHIIKDEIRNFTTNGVTDEELEDSKENYIGWLPLSVESNNGVASAIIKMERYQLGFNYMRDYPQNIRKITRDDVLRTAQKYLNPDKMVIVTAGPPLPED